MPFNRAAVFVVVVVALSYNCYIDHCYCCLFVCLLSRVALAAETAMAVADVAPCTQLA